MIFNEYRWCFEIQTNGIVRNCLAQSNLRTSCRSVNSWEALQAVRSISCGHLALIPIGCTANPATASHCDSPSSQLFWIRSDELFLNLVNRLHLFTKQRLVPLWTPYESSSGRLEKFKFHFETRRLNRSNLRSDDLAYWRVMGGCVVKVDFFLANLILNWQFVCFVSQHLSRERFGMMEFHLNFSGVLCQWTAVFSFRNERGVNLAEQIIMMFVSTDSHQPIINLWAPLMIASSESSWSQVNLLLNSVFNGADSRSDSQRTCDLSIRWLT